MPIRDCEARFDIGPDGIEPRFDRPYPYDQKLGALDKRSAVELGPLLAKRYQMTVEQLKKAGVAMSSIDVAPDGSKSVRNHPELNDLYRGTRGAVRVWGVIECLKRSADGAWTPWSMRFTARSPMWALIDQVPHEAALMESAVYHASLRTKGQNYSIGVAGLGHTIKPGEADRFTIELMASRPSFHRLRVRIDLGGGRALVSEPMLLTIFVPRSAAKEIEPA